MTVSPAAPVVVGVNGSPASLTAVRAAARQAQLHDAELRIIHAFNWLPTYDANPRGRAQAVVDHAMELAGSVAPGLTVRPRMLEGTPATLLLRESRMAALVAVGEGSLSNCTCPAVDACAVQVARRAWCNVLVTREHGSPDGPVVVGVDHCSDTGRVLDAAFDQATRLGTQVIAVRAIDPHATDDDVEEEIRRLRDLIVPRERAFALTARSVLRRGDATEVLRQESERAGMVVVGAHGDRPYGGMPGSVTQALLHHCPAPLEVVRRQPARTPRPRRPARVAPYTTVN